MLNKILDAVYDAKNLIEILKKLTLEQYSFILDAINGVNSKNEGSRKLAIKQHLLMIDAINEVKSQNEDLKKQFKELTSNHVAVMERLLMYMDTLQEPIEPIEIKSPKYNWDEAPIICELNNYRWLLGPKADKEMEWERAKIWCELKGGELPPREILLLAYLNGWINLVFKDSCYWSANEFTPKHAWIQDFDDGDQSYNSKATNCSVRAVKRVKI